MKRRGRIWALLWLVVSVAASASGAGHAPWPADWNNWSDPALWVAVGDPNNTTNYNGLGAVGSVPYTYQMGKFDVTAGQYCAFLNAVASTDTYGLYNSLMDYYVYPGSAGCCIRRTGSPGSFLYTVPSSWANRPVNFVSWGDAARFCNWLANGQPTGGQNASTTEDGSYRLNGATTLDALMAVARRPNARYCIPSGDEWHKAAYYKGGSTNAGYWVLPTRSDAGISNLLDPNGTNNANLSGTLGAPYFRTEVGAFASTWSPYGAFDMAGNVWQWDEELFYAGWGGPAETGRGVKGGSFENDAWPLQSYSSYVSSATNEAADIGFRIVAIPEPAVTSLLVLGGLALVRRRGSAEPRRLDTVETPNAHCPPR